MDHSTVKTIDRLVEILDYFATGHDSLSLAELSAYLNMPKSTLHRFLISLEVHGILRREEESRRWRLGYHLITWGGAAGESNSLRDVAHPVLLELVERVGETAILTVYHDHMVVCIDLVETSHPIRLKMAVGEQRAAHAGASSKAIMAYLPDAVIEEIVREKGLAKVCTNTITSLQQLKLELRQIRERGYATSLEETDPDAWGVATPIYDRKGKVVGAVGLAGPTTRYNKDKLKTYEEACRRAAQEISSRLSINTAILSR